jgi:anti-sigma B factor antagonist
MEIIESSEAGQLVIELKGRLDGATSKALEDRFAAILDGGAKQLVLDFAGLDYVSSAGLRVLLMAAKRIKTSQGRLAICALRPDVLEVFEISGFSKIFSLYASRAEALG